MDRHFDDQGFNDSGLKTRPSELFQRNCWISFEPVEGSIGFLAEYNRARTRFYGRPTIRIATASFPGAPAMIGERLKGVSAAAKHQIMAGGAMKFYGLN